MMLSTNFEYISRIPATEANAVTIQALTLQDVTDGRFNNPTHLANPEDQIKVDAQLTKLLSYPDKYNGFRRENGVLVAYMKSSEWMFGDEAPFIENRFARSAMHAVSKLNAGSVVPKAYGVFGLVASNELETDDRDEMLGYLLNDSIIRAFAKSARVVNIVLHDNDPVLPIADDLGFRPVSKKAEATGASGLLQQRFQLDLAA